MIHDSNEQKTGSRSSPPQGEDFVQSTGLGALSHLDFQSIPENLIRQIPQNISEAKYSSVENLISQNEDLSARLRVTLRRLSLLEMENKKFSEDLQQLKVLNQSITDKYLVYQEKDQLWKDRLDQLESEKNKYIDQYQAWQVQSRTYKQELEKFEKYQEKIKDKVRPYIESLKEENTHLRTRNEQLSTLLEETQAKFELNNQQLSDLQNHSSKLNHEMEQRYQKMLSLFEERMTEQKQEVSNLRSENEELSVRTQRFHEVMIKKDELENHCIELKNSKKETEEKLEATVSLFRSQVEDIQRKNIRYELENSDLKTHVVNLESTLQTREVENRDLITRNESLNYMWTLKSEETEKLRLALSSLEKLNLDLSQKISELRDESNKLSRENSDLFRP
ncbi:MAG: hypothetical protein ACK5WZ_11695 [Pseudobdellovibrionaceae bacterium]